MNITPFRRPAAAGFSLVDMIVTVAIIGIMAGVAVVSYKGVVERSSETVAENTVEHLNAAVTKYLQLEGTKLQTIPGDPAASTEELDILRALQWDLGDPGQPYMRPDYDPAASSSTEDYRAIWNGSYYELKTPSETGAGLKIDFKGGDLGRNVTFPDNFTPLASY